MPNTPSIDRDEIHDIAALARIAVSEEEMPGMAARIGEILAMVDTLQAADTAAVEPMANPLDATQTLRADEVTEGDHRAAFQAIAPAVEDGLYLVPRVIE